MRSFAVSRGALASRAAKLAAEYGIEVIHADGPSELAAVLTHVLERGQQRVFLLGGDGTLQALVERLVALPRAGAPTQVLILGGGRTNLTAGDLGTRRAVLETLKAGLERSRNGGYFEIEHRRTVRVEQTPAPPRHGFFLAAGLPDSVIRACHRRHASGAGASRAGPLGSAWVLLTLAALALIGRRPLPVCELEVEVPGGEALPRPARLLIATTLRRHGLLDPYAARGEGGIRVTAIAARAQGLWHRLPRLLAGRFSRGMNAAHGYLSGRCDRLQVLGVSGYTLDGQEFDADAGRPVVICGGPSISFLKP